MPLSFSTAMLVEKNRQQSINAWVWLFQLEIQGTGGTFRMAMYDQPVVFHSLTFLPFGITVDSQEDATHAALTSMRVTFQNVTQEMIALFENYWVFAENPVWLVRHWQVAVNMPNEMPFGRANVYSVQQAATDDMNAVAELVLQGITLTALIPKHRYVATNGYLFLPRR